MLIKILELILIIIIWRLINFSENIFMYTFRVLIILSLLFMISDRNSKEWIIFVILIFAPTFIKLFKKLL
ncbi:hypothetical protein CLL_0023 (plasmid) [Clostridium botulinum B str. Eklund 17B (NRP)]|uniref:Uncharacterized protein n=2 Tax=Clostridium botulinum TaxID=1491 RepID=A0A093VMI0_CLOBO|nr:hypothetical protein CLL_0023 [Clostridium botulinum B str. Eklund 17B (NRP)]AIW54508.1 hypothetical protein [Clostridium botulinum]AIW54562.1 hypothetical protein [Clostridium botulinum]AIW55035.1 hypothetical protein [Clostridium botulinum]KFX53727.1 hypothetical protein KU40_19185 [Clostridium botulinum]